MSDVLTELDEPLWKQPGSVPHIHSAPSMKLSAATKLMRIGGRTAGSQLRPLEDLDVLAMRSDSGAICTSDLPGLVIPVTIVARVSVSPGGHR